MQHQDCKPLYPHSPLPQLQPQGDIQLNSSMASAPAPPAPSSAPMNMLLGPENTITVCQFCHASIKTAVRYTVTTRTHIAASLCSMICCCCCIPYCSESAKNSDHYCPNCQRYLGTYEK